MSRWQATVGLAATVALVSVAAPAAAQTTAEGFSLNRYDPSVVGGDWFAADSLDLRGHGRFALGVTGDYAHNPLVVRNAAGDIVERPVSNQLFLHVGAAVVFWNRVRFDLSLPVALVDDGTAATLGAERYQLSNGMALGDLRVGGDVALFGRAGDPFRLAAGVQVMLPTGSRSSFTGDSKVRIFPRLLAAGDAGLLEYAAQVAFDGRLLDQTVAGHAVGPALAYAAAAGVRLGGMVVVGPELFGATSLKSGDDRTGIEALLGSHVIVARDWRLGAGVGRAFTSALGSPSVRALATIAYAPAFTEAAPPPPPPPPPPPVVAPPPPPDSDGDGIADAADACPQERGIASADAAVNGCPDRDGDGVADKLDHCPDQAGPPDPDPAKNGCPVPADGDGDGIVDEQDACPREAGVADPDASKNGCPRARVVEGEIQILDRVEFDNDKADLRPASEPILASVAKVLADHPEIKKVRVEGYTDNRGKPSRNLKLSQTRVDAVVAWLKGHGVAADRLTAKGLGQDNPVGDNATEEGRQQNRRVQFIIVEKAPPDNVSAGAAPVPAP